MALWQNIPQRLPIGHTFLPSERFRGAFSTLQFGCDFLGRERPLAVIFNQEVGLHEGKGMQDIRPFALTAKGEPEGLQAAHRRPRTPLPPGVPGGWT